MATPINHSPADRAPTTSNLQPSINLIHSHPHRSHELDQPPGSVCAPRGVAPAAGGGSNGAEHPLAKAIGWAGEQLKSHLDDKFPATSQWLDVASTWMQRQREEVDRKIDEWGIFQYEEDERAAKPTVATSSVPKIAPAGASGMWGGGTPLEREGALDMRTLFTPRSFEMVAERCSHSNDELEQIVRLHQRKGLELSAGTMSLS